MRQDILKFIKFFYMLKTYSTRFTIAVFTGKYLPLFVLRKIMLVKTHI